MPFCSNCGASNQNGKFCNQCGKPVVASGGIATSSSCAACGGSITSEFIKTAKADFHKECFKCVTCRKPITGGYAYHGEAGPFCEATCGGRKQGFTIDPRTGKKTYRN